MPAVSITRPEGIGVMGLVVITIAADTEVVLAVSVSVFKEWIDKPWDGAHVVLAGHYDY
jgi:hypothetical protein